MHYYIQILVYKNGIPPTCSFSDIITCSYLANNHWCNSAWTSVNQYGIASCPSTSGFVKDNCKNECGNYNRK